MTVQAAVAQLVSARSDEFKPVPLSATEARLVAGITDLLANEPFDVTHSGNTIFMGVKCLYFSISYESSLLFQGLGQSSHYT